MFERGKPSDRGGDVAAVGAGHALLDNVELAWDLDDVDAPGFTSRLVDPIVLLEGDSEEAAAWQQAGELERERAILYARQARTVAHGYTLARRAGRDKEDVLGELRATYAVSRRAAENDLYDALVLCAHPRTLTVALDGGLRLRQLRAMIDVLGELDRDLAERVEIVVLPLAADRDPARIRELARREAIRLDPEHAARRRKEAAKRRAAVLSDAGDGMVDLTLHLRAEQGLAIMNRAEAETARDDGSGRTRDQRRADWIVATLLAEAGQGSGRVGAQEPGTGGRSGAVAAETPVDDAVFVDPVTGTSLVLSGTRRRPVQVLVRVPVTTALDLDDAPCDLERVGPVDAELGRSLMTVAELRKVCVDGVSGEVLHVEDEVFRPVADRKRIRELRRRGSPDPAGQAQAEAVREALITMVREPSFAPVVAEPQYRPSSGLSRTVKTRHPRCDFPGCGCPSRLCDDEHSDPYPFGQTALSNLAPRSRGCHRLKQKGWRPVLMPDGSTSWQSPLGRTYTSPAQHEPPPVLSTGARLGAPRRIDPDADPDAEPDADCVDEADGSSLAADAATRPRPHGDLSVDPGRAAHPGAPHPPPPVWSDEPPF